MYFLEQWFPMCGLGPTSGSQSHFWWVAKQTKLIANTENVLSHMEIKTEWATCVCLFVSREVCLGCDWRPDKGDHKATIMVQWMYSSTDTSEGSFHPPYHHHHRKKENIDTWLAGKVIFFSPIKQVGPNSVSFEKEDPGAKRLETTALESFSPCLSLYAPFVQSISCYFLT